ncbi:tripartite tricarboxylate transporter TctB family protein, partial [Streptomyces albidoflavus]|uniref:tripartite tricarboxylate transporter TctB family protein n=1 Tax=Streptomyces albidoflavus TaxID=1886 RepID=UPI003F61CC76
MTSWAAVLWRLIVGRTYPVVGRAGDLPTSPAGACGAPAARVGRRAGRWVVGFCGAAAVLVEPVGFPVAGALLCWGTAYALGSRRIDRDPLIAAVLALFTYVVFNNLLGVPLPGGP